ncbi:SNG1 family protein [Paenibacillus sp. sptzw28]|uniref:YhgE/Pip domain-containing protein n=1 Tax=Paenibacillus sp. sptzw28 TaxID=715179 RepID=UPI001C6EE66E|nr:ABC transporter permease [Paenibacillus sp. sptzw28]QYR20741.1 SNG1 family protein [Paenibacillus sp. sptzw28]
MGTAVKAFMKKPTTLIGIMTALMFQVIFSVIWMTGYDGVTDADRLKQLRVGLVALDAQMGPAIAEKLQKSLPVHSELIADAEEARRLLNERRLQMVITIPADFSQALMTRGGKAALQYTLNESNPALIKSMMSSIASQVTATVNKEAISRGALALLTQTKLPAGQAEGSAAELSERVTSSFTYSNKVNGMNNQMVPMMLVLASFVGAMIMGMNLQQSSMAVAPHVGRFQLFAARSAINAAAAIVVSLVGSSLVMALGGQAEQGFLAMWGFQALFLLTFLFVTQMFLILFGMAGMLFNIILLSAQLVSSGAMVPRELLSDFYLGLGKIFPATYAVEGSMNILFGGPGIGDASLGLLIIVASAALVGALAVLRKGRMPQQQTKPVQAV